MTALLTRFDHCEFRLDGSFCEGIKRGPHKKSPARARGLGGGAEEGRLGLGDKKVSAPLSFNTIGALLFLRCKKAP